MHSLTIVFGPSPVPWVLLYRDAEKAADAYMHVQNIDADITGSTVTLIDDFGQQVFIRARTISGVMLEDLELSKMAHVEQGLHRARTQAKAQTMAQGDPTLRAASVMGGAPMLSPMGNGAFRGQ